MTKNISSKPIDARAYETLVAEEEMILHAQMLIQRVLNDRRISQKALAERLGVGESYVSQMLGTSARNLTLRTIARVMEALDVKATLVLDDHADVQLAAINDDERTAAVASRVASVRFSKVWGEAAALPPRERGARRSDDDARAYAAFDPPVQEMAMAA